MATIRVRILGEADEASFARGFKAYESAAKRATARAKGESNRARQERITADTRAAASIYRDSARVVSQQERLEKQSVVKRQRVHENALRHVARVRDRHFAQQQRQEEKASRTAQRNRERASKEFVSGTRSFGSTVASGVVGTARYGIGAARSITAGLGVDLSAQSHIQKGVAYEKNLIGIANTQGFNRGSPATKADVTRIDSAIKGAAGSTSTDINAMVEGLAQYQAMTGDLDAGIDSLEFMGQVARATGADFQDVAATMANIGKALPQQTVDRAGVLADTVRVFAKQAAVGSVEFAELAKDAGKFTSQAFRFAGDRATTIGILGGLAQQSMLGGRATGKQAATAAGNFGQDVTKNAKRFGAAGIEIYADPNHHNKGLRSADQIILESLQKTDGDAGKLSKLFSNLTSRAGVMGFANVYNAAGGGASGLDAVKAEFAKYTGGVSQDQVEAAFALSKSSTEAKATDANNKLQEIAIDALPKLADALVRATPLFEKLGKVLADVTSWVIDNPGEAIAAAIVANIARAGIGSAVSGALSKAIGGGGGGGSGLLGGGSIMIAAASVAVVASEIATGKLLDGQTKSAGADADIGNKMVEARTTEDFDKVEQQIMDRMRRAREFETKFSSGRPGVSSVHKAGSGLWNELMNGLDGTSFENQGEMERDSSVSGIVRNARDLADVKRRRRMMEVRGEMAGRQGAMADMAMGGAAGATGMTTTDQLMQRMLGGGLAGAGEAQKVDPGESIRSSAGQLDGSASHLGASAAQLEVAAAAITQAAGRLSTSRPTTPGVTPI